ncbi:hypothetical protein BDF22DRAFT_745690 [Syncephalis plumigaleata]|nr:hypothetical protein BDF22DRAFT_745690 [Syncephalis plumigaleata]
MLGNIRFDFLEDSNYGDQSWANRLRHARFYKIVYGAGLSIAALAWIMSFVESWQVLLAMQIACPARIYLSGSVLFATLLTIGVIVVPIEALVRLLALGRQFFVSVMDVGDLSLGVIMMIIALVTAWGECSSTKHRIAALMAVLCIARNGLQLIRLLMAVRKDQRNRSAREATIEFADVRGYSMESDRNDGDFALGDSDDDDTMPTGNKTKKPQGSVGALPV